ncbi:MAG: hypothetical protein HDT43_08405 [Ruminococcaceae bacterium]|nr:hypothetical protein [Oscillospiraceae bacterium]
MDKKSLLKAYDLEDYLSYDISEEALAILFVRKYLNQANKNVWVDILSYELPTHYDAFNLEFEQVKCELFPKKTKPKYPPKSQFSCDADYRYVCRAITWETAHEDIRSYRNKGYKGKKYVIDGVRFHLKINSRNYFVDEAPPEIKALAKNVNDRTDPLWDKAVEYIRYPWVFRIKGIKRDDT